MKLSFRLTVFLTLVAVTIVCVWVASYRRSQQALAIDHYRKALKSGVDAYPCELVAACGVDRSREVMMLYSNKSSDVVLDGSDRWVQVLRVPHAHGIGQGDGYTLYSLRGGITHGWTLPKGTVLQSVDFADEEIVFRVYGRITQGSFQYTISKDRPAEYRLPWKRGASVPYSHVTNSIAREFCVESNRAD